MRGSFFNYWEDEIYLGCDVCVWTCVHCGHILRSRPERVITPLNSVHRSVMMAIKRGDLQNMMLANRVLWRHRALAALLDTPLRLPLLKQIKASQQEKPRTMEYIEAHNKL